MFYQFNKRLLVSVLIVLSLIPEISISPLPSISMGKASTAVISPVNVYAAPVTDDTVPSTGSIKPAALNLAAGTIRFGVIGDYGDGSQPEQDVANRLKSWDLDIVTTTGDNNYADGGADTIDPHVGQFYQEFIYPYRGTYGPGASTNRFFPALGNHDWTTSSARPYLDYFTLPGNERYYDYVWGPVHFFVLDSDDREPDGNTVSSKQAAWLQNRLGASTSAWNLVYLHHSPYSSGSVHPSDVTVQWPYAAWGADAVLSAHSHTYERILRDGIVYFVNGLGGGSIHTFGTPVQGSQVRYNGDYGAMLVNADTSQITFQFISRAGAVIDTYTLTQTFGDVPPSYWASEYIERLYTAGVTSGCNTSLMLYCPTTPVTRDQMAVFLLRAKHGSSYTPPNATGMFEDVPTSYWAADWIERLAAEGITSGCNVSPMQYCPTTPVTRDQMAVFLLKAKHGSTYKPPKSTGIFEDVPPSYWAADWIEQLAKEGVTAGCSTSPMLYCPATPVSRDQMAVFLVRNFNLP
jgi:tartrate-resistant acid phosphatase type 5